MQEEVIQIMLTLKVHSGDYIAIGDNIFVQVYRTRGDGFAVAVDAPKVGQCIRRNCVSRSAL